MNSKSNAIAAQVDGEPCCAYIGDNGAGHYVKMVHNGVEYGDMQLISEAYYLMENALGMNTEQMQKVFAEWNKGDLDSYLIEITAAESGIAVAAFSSALNYFDSYRTGRLSANMIQAQRDYFGAHTYERVDKEGTYHTEWLKI